MNAARNILAEESGKKWIKCREGWISYTQMAGNKYHITATGHNQHIIEGRDLHYYLEELIKTLGGRARG